MQGFNNYYSTIKSIKSDINDRPSEPKIIMN